MFFVTHVLLLIVLADFCNVNCREMNLETFTDFVASSRKLILIFMQTLNMNFTVTFVRETLYMCILWRLKGKWNRLFDDMIFEK